MFIYTLSLSALDTWLKHIQYMVNFPKLHLASYESILENSTLILACPIEQLGYSRKILNRVDGGHTFLKTP